MEKINEIPKISNKERGISNKMTVSFSLASILKLVLAIALFVIFALIVNAGDVIVESGKINVDGKLFVNDAGNVGIGTTSPSEKLSVVGNIYMTGSNYLATGGELDLRSYTGRDITVSPGGTEKVRITSGGNVGIGTASPTGGKLHILTTAGASALHLDGTGAQLDFGNFDSIASITSEAGGTGLRFKARGGNYPDLVVATTGNVGIGTTSPSEKLEVAGNIKAENLGKVIWSTSTSGTYSLRTIFDSARSSGLVPGVYDCVLRTSNQAHWTGRRFTASVNYYINNPSYPHQFYNAFDVQAGSSGCSGGLTSFDGSTGAFTFDPGNCFQSISLVCNRLY